MLIKSVCIVVYEYELSKSLNAYLIFKMYYGPYNFTKV